jgi:hypothetical protein
VINTVLEQYVEGAVGLGLGGPAEGRAAEDDGGALVSGAAKGLLLDHGIALSFLA